MFKNRKNYWLLAFILIVFAFFHYQSIDNFFSQDDFYHLALARVDSLTDIVNFFNPWQQESAYFRPLGTQVFFALAFIFPVKVAPIVLHLVAIGFHLANFYLLFLIFKKTFSKETLALSLAGAYLLSSVHFLSLYYLAAFQQILAAFWQFLAIYAFVNNKKKRVYVYYFLALLTKETALVFPALLLIFSYIISPPKKLADYWLKFRHGWSYWRNFFLVILPYGLIRLLSWNSLNNDGYQTSFSPRTFLGSWRWYFTWLLGAPESAINYTGRVFRFDLGTFLKDSGWWGRIFLVAFLAELVLFCLLAIYFFLKKRKKTTFFQSLSPLVLFGLFFVISLLLVSPFPYHRYSHYLDLALFGFLLTIGVYYCRYQFPKRLWVLLAIAFLVTSYASLAIDSHLHWTTARSDIAQEVFEVFEDQDLCSQEAVYFLDSNLPAQEINVALLNSWGADYFCHYQGPQVYYQGISSPALEEQAITVTID